MYAILLTEIASHFVYRNYKPFSLQKLQAILFTEISSHFVYRNYKPFRLQKLLQAILLRYFVEHFKRR